MGPCLCRATGRRKGSRPLVVEDVGAYQTAEWHDLGCRIGGRAHTCAAIVTYIIYERVMMLLEEPVRTARRRAVWGRRHEPAKPNLPVRLGLLDLEHTRRNECIPHKRRCSELGACRTYSARATGPALATALPCRTTKAASKRSLSARQLAARPPMACLRPNSSPTWPALGARTEGTAASRV